MSEEKVTVEPEKEPKSTVEAPILDKRQEIEKLVAEQNQAAFEAPVPEDNPEKVEEPAKEIPKEEKAPDKELDPVEQIKLSMQKRINKLTAKTKTAEEELAELRAENQRLKEVPKAPEVIPDPKDNTPPTPEQVEAYIAKMSEEGNHKEVAAATRYLIKLEKEIALKEVAELQTKTQSETRKQNEDMKILANDYVVMDEQGKPDIKADMTLANQNGLLFKLAMDYWNDPVRHKDRYDNPNVVEGFRRSVADAYRDIQEHYKQTPKGTEIIEPRRNPRQALAEPESDGPEDTPSPRDSNTLSDAEKVRAEINQRNKNRYARKVPQ